MHARKNKRGESGWNALFIILHDSVEINQLNSLFTSWHWTRSLCSFRGSGKISAVAVTTHARTAPIPSAAHEFWVRARSELFSSLVRWVPQDTKTAVAHRGAYEKKKVKTTAVSCLLSARARSQDSSKTHISRAQDRSLFPVSDSVRCENRCGSPCRIHCQPYFLDSCPRSSYVHQNYRRRISSRVRNNSVGK